MTMNIHSLLHIVDCVRNFGPLWCYSMFSFEAYNGLLKSFAVAPTDVLHQIMIRYLCFKTIEGEQTVETTDSSILKNEIKSAPQAHHIAAIKEADLNEENTIFYARFEKSSTVLHPRHIEHPKRLSIISSKP